ncbi:MAG: radical SAM protein [Phycisphaerae bacterium]|nr:radical SAM protein [Phycisphaerae bacterium]MDD5381202.1 radical SAM protein [Phycisphaerae bacterium]
MINISKLYCGLAGESDHLRYAQHNSFGPVVAYNCTSRCNLNCLHCYSSSTSGLGSDELTTTEAKQLLHQLAEANCPVILFTGGEPLLRDDLFELLAEAKQLSLRTVISTNGTLIDSAAAKKLAEVGVRYVGISIDGEESFHDKFRQSNGCFKAALTGIANCQKTDLKTGLRFTITKQNAEQIPAVFDIAAEASIRRICFYHLVKAGRAKNLDEFILTPQQTRNAIDTIIEKTGEFVQKKLVDEVLTVGNHADGPYLLLKMNAEANPLYEKAEQLLLTNGGNKTGEKIACIGWDGSVHPDQFWRNYSLGNIKNKPFKEIWNNPAESVLNKLRNKNRFADKRCLKCKWFDLCKGNFRFLGQDPSEKNWLLEPPCYLAEEEIKK